MKITKAAKILTPHQIEALIRHVHEQRHGTRNAVMVLLSFKAGLRAAEIAGLTWGMVLKSDGTIDDAVTLRSKLAKSGSGGVIPINKILKSKLTKLLDEIGTKPSETSSVIRSGLGGSFRAQSVVNQFARWYHQLGFEGCSSHSGRRTFITNCARRVSSVGGSMRDVQALARHSSLAMTQRYVDTDPKAQSKLVELV